MSADQKHSAVKFQPSFRKIGKGPKPALAFHGFGQDSSYYTCMEPVIGKEYTIFSFDLPFHGDDTTEKTETPIGLQDIRTFFNDFFNTHDIESFMSIGFSIGAKISLAMMALFPERTERILLIAPDGIKANLWYRLATGSTVTRSLFRSFINHPDIYFRLSDALVRWGFVPPGVARFARSQMSSAEKRQKVYFTWMYFRKLRYSKALIVRTLERYKIPLEVYLGNADQIIRPDHFRFLGSNPGINFQLKMLITGHNHLIEETAKYLSDHPL